ncbi:hypothetical protein B0H14DRAFT_2357848 [Mycena olivaceomarginata]|nr:hypothetical protein B0H14DRAFT_2357848 [Mycena olivaceomarginata]
MENSDTRDTRKRFVIDIPSPLVHPLGPSVSRPSSSTDSSPTWTISTAQLTEMMEHAWQLLNPEGPEIAANVAQLPSLVVNNLPGHLTQVKLKENVKIPCHICGVTKKLNVMRHHVGRHIMLSGRDVSEEGLIEPVGLEPCGFCGLDGCFTQLINADRKKPTSIKSSCPYHYSRMNYKAAKTSTKSSPSTNIPIHCSLCPINKVSRQPQTIWKYNAMYHIITEHSLHTNQMPMIPHEFMAELFIRQAEEDALGITEAQTRQWRQDHQIPDSDAIDMLPLSSSPTTPAASSKRARAATQSTGSEISESDQHKSKKPQTQGH